MARLLHIYFNAVFGALGGLLAWLLFSEFVNEAWDWWPKALLGGALIGAFIGYFVVSVDAILARSWVRFCRYAAFGVILGAGGGLFGYWLGDYVNYFCQPSAGQEWTFLRKLAAAGARGLGFMFLGLAVGASEGVAARSMGKFWYGTIGGALGGLLGGMIFGWEVVSAQAAGILQKDSNLYTWGTAIAYVILGACIGALTALVEEVFKPAALKVMRGWREGHEFPLIKPASVVGRDEAVDILLLRDMKVEKRHVVIHRRGNRFVLVNNQAPADQTLVNEEPVAESCELKDGDRIQLGNVVMRFLMRAAVERNRGPRR
jgi:hypothetical protein